MTKPLPKFVLYLDSGSHNLDKVKLKRGIIFSILAEYPSFIF